jgi:hypothetical protein
MKTRDVDLEFAATSSKAKSGNSTPVLTYLNNSYAGMSLFHGKRRVNC